MIIDFENHYFPEELVRKYGGRPGEVVMWMDKDIPRMPLHDGLFQVEKRLEDMDAAGVDRAVLTSWDPTLEEARLINDRLAAIQKKYPSRFVSFACTQPLRGKPALEELERAINGLGLKGVVMTAQVEGKPLDSPELFPLYEKVARLDVPIYIHPSITVLGMPFIKAPYDLHRTLGREFDLCIATIRLMMGGILEDFPGLNFVISHLGGGIAAFVERLEGGERRGPIPGARMKRPFREYLGRLYFNMAGAGIKAITGALTILRPEQLVFATDYPMAFANNPQGLRDFIQEIRGLPLPKGAIEGMLGKNAAKLLKI